MAEPTIAVIERQSVQTKPDATKNPYGENGFWSFVQTRAELLPAWGTRQRENELRLWDRHPQMWIWQGAVSGLTKKLSSAPYEIKGGKNLVGYFDGVLRYANFRLGWDDLMSKVVRDFLRHDNGAFIEIIAPGSPKRPPTGRVTGIAHLDSLRCFPTGDPEYPTMYYDRDGRMHLLHHTRVVHLVDMPDGDEGRPGYGLCALSRGIAIATQELYMNRFIQTKLDDKPEPGYVFWKGVSEQQRVNRFEAFRNRQAADDPAWGRVIHFESLDPSNPVGAESLTFAQQPDNWSYKEYTELHVNAWALALGVDVQELWQLTGGNIGSGQQSQVLHAKSQGKTFGDLLTKLERALNTYVLPDSLEFQFKRHDPYESDEKATTAGKWASFTQSVSSTLSPDEQRRLLANMVEPYKDAVMDVAGDTQRLYDTDVQAGNEDESVADDSNTETGNIPNLQTANNPVANTQPIIAPEKAPPPPKPNATTDGTLIAPAPQPPAPPIDPKLASGKPSSEDILKLLEAGLITIGHAQEQLKQPVDADLQDMYLRNGVPVPKDVLLQLYETQFGRGVDTFSNALIAKPSNTSPSQGDGKAHKSIQATRLDFEADFGDLINAGRKGDIESRRFDLLARAQLAKSITRAFEDALIEAGIEDAEMDADEKATVLRLVADANSYVTDLTSVIYSETGLSEAEAALKPTLWYNKSIAPSYDAGRLSADRNGLYEFVGDDGDESCDTCKRLKGQTHRMKDWARKKMRPRVDTQSFVCGGWQCNHHLTKTTGRTKGRF